MAKKFDTQKAFSDLMADIKGGIFLPVYVLMGEEGYYIDELCDCILENALKEEERDFNQVVMYGADANPGQVILQARRLPMMAERQVVMLKEAQNMKGLEELEKYMDNPVRSTVLVICYKGGKIDGRKKLVSKAESVGTVFLSEPLKYDKDIIAFMKPYLGSGGRNATIEARAAEVVAAHIGGDLKRLTSELDKVLISFAPGDKREITLDLVEEKIGISKNYNVFEFRDALVARDAAKSYRIAKYYNSNPKSGGLFGLLPQTFALFQDLMLAFYIPRPVDNSAIMSYLGYHYQFQVNTIKLAMRNFTPRKTLEIIAKLREIDARSKGLDSSSNTSPEELLLELVAFILH